jgi:syntaxin-binding protein 1
MPQGVGGEHAQEELHYSLSHAHCAVVDNVAVKREPLPKLAGVYFITPSNESIARVIEDFEAAPLYKTAHVFFSSPAGPAALAAIRACPGLTSRLRNLKEVPT